MVLDDAIAWCNKVAQAMQSPDSTLNQYWQEYLDHMGGLLSRGPTHLSKASLMFAIEDLVPQTILDEEEENAAGGDQNEQEQEPSQEPPPEEEVKEETA